MDTFYEQLAELARADEPVATATVVGARGSTPREVGAKMIVRRSGAILGSVGGGCGEAQVFWEAARVLDKGTPVISEVDLTGEMNDLSPTHCGGVMEVFVDRVRWDAMAAVGLSDSDVVTVIRDAQGARRAVALAVAVANPEGLAGIPVGTKWIVGSDGVPRGALRPGLGAALSEAATATLASGRSHRLWLRQCPGGWEPAEADEGLGLFIEVIAPPHELIVVGAGHIALPLVKMARLLGFHVTVLDDRGAFANRERFPEADAVLVGRIEDMLKQRPIDPTTYVVLVTRGHQFDEAALKIVIGSEAAYIGMIGSRRRVREVFRHLSAAGLPAHRISRIHAPIGLDIGAETPSEIAVAIAAELVQVRRGGTAQGRGHRCGAS